MIDLWFRVKGEVKAMIAEYGSPTLFLTLSCAEYGGGTGAPPGGTTGAPPGGSTGAPPGGTTGAPPGARRGAGGRGRAGLGGLLILQMKRYIATHG